MSLRPKKKRKVKRKNTHRRKMTPSASESTIAGKRHSEETKAKMRESWTPERRAAKSIAMMDENNPMYGKTRTHTKETKAKISASQMGEKNVSKRPEVRAKISAALTGHATSKETRAKISAAKAEQWKDTEYRDKHTGEKHHMYGKTRSEETRNKQSGAWTPEKRAEQSAAAKLRVGEKSSGWKGGISFEPYCPAFNDRVKEHVRNLYDRTCTICGKSTLQNRQRLSVDHIDENKMQGCDDWEWRLTPLCRACHAKMTNEQKHLLLQLLLLKNKRGEIDFGERV